MCRRSPPHSPPSSKRSGPDHRYGVPPRGADRRRCGQSPHRRRAHRSRRSDRHADRDGHALGQPERHRGCRRRREDNSGARHRARRDRDRGGPALVAVGRRHPVDVGRARVRGASGAGRGSSASPSRRRAALDGDRIVGPPRLRSVVEKAAVRDRSGGRRYNRAARHRPGTIERTSTGLPCSRDDESRRETVERGRRTLLGRHLCRHPLREAHDDEVAAIWGDGRRAGAGRPAPAGRRGAERTGFAERTDPSCDAHGGRSRPVAARPPSSARRRGASTRTRGSPQDRAPEASTAGVSGGCGTPTDGAGRASTISLAKAGHLDPDRRSQIGRAHV